MANQKFITIEGNDKKLKSGISVSTGISEAGKIVCLNNDGKLDYSLFGAGITLDSYVFPASEIISPNSLVGIWNDAGTVKVKNALANVSTGVEAIGYTKDGVTAIGDNCTILLEGEFDYVGAVANTSYFLSDTVAGQPTSTAPSASGTFISCIGKSYDSGKIRFEQSAGDVIYID